MGGLIISISSAISVDNRNSSYQKHGSGLHRAGTGGRHERADSVNGRKIFEMYPNEEIHRMLALES